jgi:hypothetical protein
MNIALAHKFTTAEPTHDCSAIHTFFVDHRDALRHAASLLGGHDAEKLVDEITEVLNRAQEPSRRAVELLYKLEDLLALEHVSDPDRVETGFFASIDLLDPVVEEICLLTDDLRSAMSALPKRQSCWIPGVRQNSTRHAPRTLRQDADALAFPAETKGDAL